MANFLLDILGQVIAGMLVVLIAGSGWLWGPLRWPIERWRLLEAIRGNRFRMVFNPTTGANKHVTFLPNGQIGEGRNSQEHAWRIRRGKLEIIDANGETYSRFRFDSPTGRLVHTNDLDVKSIREQYFVPQWQRVRWNEGEDDDSRT